VKKYFRILSLSWQNGLAYRADVILWRFRQFLNSLMSLTVWSVIFTQENSLFGYSKDQMITYIFIAAFLQGFILATSLHGLASRVYSGELSALLLKPISLFAYFSMEELADKAKNVFFVLIESAILFVIFKPILVIANFGQLLLFILWAMGGAVLNFFFSLLFGTLGFWSPETWGPKFLFFILADFSAGKLFPLDIMPELLQKFIFMTPFPYLAFMQTQLFLGKLSSSETIYHTLVLFSWIVALSLINKFLWKKGLRHYEAAGQ